MKISVFLLGLGLGFSPAAVGQVASVQYNPSTGAMTSTYGALPGTVGVKIPSGGELEILSGATIKADAGATVTGFGLAPSGSPTAGQVALWASSSTLSGQTLATWTPTLEGITLSRIDGQYQATLASAARGYGFAVTGTTFELVDLTEGPDLQFDGSQNFYLPHYTTNGVLATQGGTGLVQPIANGSNGTFLGVSGGVLGYYTPSGAGNVTGPGSSTSGDLASFSGTSGTVIQDTGIASANVVTLAGTQTLTNKTLTSPTLTTPNIGAASASSLNVSGLTASSLVATDGSKNLTSTTSGVSAQLSTLALGGVNGAAAPLWIHGATNQNLKILYDGSTSMVIDAVNDANSALTAMTLSASSFAIVGDTFMASNDYTLGASSKINVASAGTDGMTLYGSADSIQLSRTSNPALFIRRQSTTGDVADFYYGTTEVGNISVTGSATAYNTSSDQRLKTNFHSWSLGDAFDRLPIGEFIWKSNGSTGHGTLAQKLYPIFPDAVLKGDDGATVTKQWQVDYSKLVIPTIARVQEDDRRLDDLESALHAEHADLLRMQTIFLFLAAALGGLLAFVAITVFGKPPEPLD